MTCLVFVLAAGFAAMASCAGASNDLGIPSESDWSEHGVVLRAGPTGSWDERFAGASTPAAVIKTGGKYLLYYGGADGKRAIDGGPRHRALGVATSPDGIHFTKYSGNPIVTHRPKDGEEEGANSAAIVLEPDGRFVLLYGAATEIDPESINADARIAVSTDGLEFRDLDTVALDHRDSSLYGYGDEIFPLAAYRHLSHRYLFYVTGGGQNPRDLAVAWGPAWDQLQESSLVVDGSVENPARMAANVNWLGTNRIAIFVQRGWYPEVSVEVRTADPLAPHRLSRPLEVYDGVLWREQTKFFTVFLDTERKTWLLYRLNWQQEFVLHTAPYRPGEETPPPASVGRSPIEGD